MSQNRVGPQLVVGFNSWFCLEHVVPKTPLVYKRGHRQSHLFQHQSSHSCLSEVFATDETNIADIHSAVSWCPKICFGSSPGFVRLSQEVFFEDIGGIQSHSTEVSKRDSFGMCVVRDEKCIDLFLDLGGGRRICSYLLTCRFPQKNHERNNYSTSIGELFFLV